ncbi:MAG: ACT domain-containing protein [Rhodobacteraceae bacterium]|nr:ACT domain-containing protein [Paracoccaceae bacterium]
MTETARTRAAMVSGMTPELLPGCYVFCTARTPEEAAALAAQAIGTFREAEGLSAILPVEAAAALGCDLSAPMCCITLQVYSALDGVGLTAAVASALAAQGIACNVVAAFHHDHAFVPAEAADRALAILRAVQANG